MTFATRLLDKTDKFQQGKPWLALPVATWKKFSDDQAGNLAALIAYYAFGSVFPLLLVFVTILDLVVRNNASLREKLLSSALSQYPVIGDQIRSSVAGGISGTGFALVIGVILTLYGARGVAVAIQNAMNTVWAVPRFQRPRGLKSLLRSLGLILVLGPGLIITSTLSSVAGGAGHLGYAGGRVAAVAVSLVLNIGLFWLGLRVATAPKVGSHKLWLSAILCAIGWQLLQLLGGYFIGHQLRTHSAYGVFAVVLGLLAWLFLQAQMTLYIVELDVVRTRRLWPRTLVAPTLGDADLRSYRLLAQSSQRSPDLQIEVRQAGHEAEDGGPDRQ